MCYWKSLPLLPIVLYLFLGAPLALIQHYIGSSARRMRAGTWMASPASCPAELIAWTKLVAHLVMDCKNGSCLLPQHLDLRFIVER
jgi:hypothetical protein